MKNEVIHPISGSNVSNLNTGNANFQYSLQLHFPLNKTKKIVKNVLVNFKQDFRAIKILKRLTWSDGSESDLWGHYGIYGHERLLIQIEHRWLDPHFLLFTFNAMQDGEEKQPIDNLFPEIVLEEAHRGKSKFGEILIKTCYLNISTQSNDPKFYIPESVLNEKTQAETEELSLEFWNNFSAQEYKKAETILQKLSQFWENGSGQRIFLDALLAICYFKAGENPKSIELFIATANNFALLSIQSYCDLCLFFAIDVATRTLPMSELLAAVVQLAKQIPDLSPFQREEMIGILQNYAMQVNIGVVVLCRRLVEITLERELKKKFNKSLSVLVKECNKTGKLNGKLSTGLYQLLMVAKWKGLLSSDQLKIAQGIKGSGDRIHDGINTADRTDARFTLQACIRLIRETECKNKITNDV